MIDPSLRIFLVVSAVFLGTHAAAMYGRGYWYGRVAASTASSAVIKRAGLWSLILSWTVMIGFAGHGVATLILPAWLVAGSQIGWYLGLAKLHTRYTWFAPYGGFPPAFLSIACSMGASVFGVVRGLSRSSKCGAS